MNKNSKVIAFCFDKNYVQYCQVALLSLIINNGTEFKIYCFYLDEIEQDDLNAIKLIGHKYGMDLNLIKISLETLSQFKIHSHFSHATYMRLLLPDLLGTLDRVLYLDCDIIVDNSINELFELDISNYKYFGVFDQGGSNTSRIDQEFKINYINGGVLMMNLSMLRADDSFEKMKVLYAQHEHQITYVDQCLINIYAHKDILLLDDKYNFQIFSGNYDKRSWLEIKEKKSIYHFVGGVKPWHNFARKHISDFWLSYANLLKNDKLKLIEGNKVSESMLECKSLEEYDRYKESSHIKDRIIKALVDRVNEQQNIINLNDANRVSEAARNLANAQRLEDALSKLKKIDPQQYDTPANQALLNGNN